MMFTQMVLISFWSFLMVNADCDNLLVNTNIGAIVGFVQKTFVNQKSYVSYKGIPYAQPRIGALTFRVN